MGVTILLGDCTETLRTVPAGTFQCCVTSPPYYGLRDYGVAGQIGLEDTPDAYIARMVEVFREVRRVLRDDGTLWLNIGDSYNSATKGSGGATAKQVTNAGAFFASRKFNGGVAKEKDLLGIPWMLAFALRADGWYLRKDIIWQKPNPMPESITDRPTSSHEHVFLLAKAKQYFYDAEAIKEPAAVPGWDDGTRVFGGVNKHGANARHGTRTTGRVGGERNDLRSTLESRHRARIPGGQSMQAEPNGTRNARDVWTIATQPYSGAHFATMPPALAERCIKAGSRTGDHVLDPFGGAGTTGLVADRLGRHATLCELNPAYAALARERITGDAPLLVEAHHG